MRKRKIAVDLDGVLHSYTSPWKAPDHIPDPPVAGAIEWLNHIRFAGQCEVFIFTTRAQTLEGIRAVQRWLLLNGVIAPENIVVTQQKLAADIYIDDRAYCFTGANFPTIEEVNEFQRWGHVP